jgi:hypothetical protein
MNQKTEAARLPDAAIVASWRRHEEAEPDISTRAADGDGPRRYRCRCRSADRSAAARRGAEAGALKIDRSRARLWSGAGRAAAGQPLACGRTEAAKQAVKDRIENDPLSIDWENHDEGVVFWLLPAGFSARVIRGEK